MSELRLTPHTILQIQQAQKAHAANPATAPHLITIDVRDNYEHREYPKIVNSGLVQNRAEEDAAHGCDNSEENEAVTEAVVTVESRFKGAEQHAKNH